MEEPQPGAGYSSTNNDNDNNTSSSNISSKDHGEAKMTAGVVGESGAEDVVGRSNGQADASVGANAGYPGGGGGERSGAQSQPIQQAEGDENRYDMLSGCASPLTVAQQRAVCLGFETSNKRRCTLFCGLTHSLILAHTGTRCEYLAALLL